MDDALPAETKICGTCSHAQACTDGKIDCWGGPPTPILVGVRPGRIAGVEMQIEVVRPHLDRNTRACGAYRLGLQLLGSAAGQVLAVGAAR